MTQLEKYKFNNEPIRILEFFSGVGMQRMAFDKLGVNYESVGTSEIDIPAILSYAAIHDGLLESDETFEYPTKEEMLNYLSERNIGLDFKTGKLKLPKNLDKIKQLYRAVIVSKCFGDISQINPNDLPDFDFMTYSFPCFIEGTLVLTSNGYKPIEDITENDYVLTHTNTYQKVVKPMVNEANHIYKLSTMASEDLFVTEEHPFYVRKRERKWNNERRSYDRVFHKPEWIKTKDLDKSYYVGCAINQKSELPKWDGVEFNGAWGHKVQKNELCDLFEKNEFWWLVGRFIGDGWTRNYKTDKFHSEKVVICCGKHKKDEIVEVLDRLPFNYSVVEERTVYKFHIVNKELTRFLYQFGKGASNKRLTSDVINLPVDLLESFLEGYISSDGYITEDGLIKISSVSQKLIYDTAQCIMKVYKRPVSVYLTKRKPTCVIEGRTVNQKDTYTVTFKKVKNKQDKAFYEDGYVWCPINNIEKLDYNGLVYNMEVENDNSYVVQNIIVHNCTDISVAGRKDGVIKGQTRSGLLYECEKVIECKRPKYLLLENVKNLVGKQFKPQFDEWLEYLETLGYTNYWKVLNSKSFGVPQNRERVFVLSILGEHDPYEFHNGFELDIRLKDILEFNVDEKYYLSKEVQDRFKPNDKFKDMSGNIVGTTAPDFRTIGQRDLCYQENSVMGTLVATDYKQPKQIVERIGGLFDDEKHIRQAGGVYNVDGLSPTLTAMYNGYKQPCVIDNSNKPYFVDRQGRVQEFDLKENYIQWDTSKKQYNSQQDRAFYDEKLSGTIATNAMANVIENSEPLICASRGRNVENPSDRTSGTHTEQRLEINYSGTSNTLTTVQKDNYVLEPNVLRVEHNDIIDKQCENNVNIIIGSTQKNAYVGNGEMSPTLTSAMGTGGGHIPMIGNIPNFRIRKLTPKECWRLMGIDDECFDKAEQVNSNSQLYKQAGNGIVVNVLYYIFKELFKDDIVDCKKS